METLSLPNMAIEKQEKYGKFCLLFLFHKPQPLKQVKILFEEYFFNSLDQSYQVLCIDQPLEGGRHWPHNPLTTIMVFSPHCVCTATDELSYNVTSLETLQDCYQFLWFDSGLCSMHTFAFCHFCLHLLWTYTVFTCILLITVALWRFRKDKEICW